MNMNDCESINLAAFIQAVYPNIFYGKTKFKYHLPVKQVYEQCSMIASDGNFKDLDFWYQNLPIELLSVSRIAQISLLLQYKCFLCVIMLPGNVTLLRKVYTSNV